MKFKNKREAVTFFRDYKSFKGVFPDYWSNGRFSQMGEWLLFKHIKHTDKGYNISRPILALVVGHTIWDQALVIEFVEEWRAFHFNNYIGDYYIMEEDKDVDHIQFWTDDIEVMGSWKHKPTFRELKKAMK